MKIVVAGGGAAGMMAAIAAAGQGAEVVLFEKMKSQEKDFYHGKGQMQPDQCL